MNPKILIRFDDICPTMDFEEWNKAVEVLEKYSVKPLIGVIPNCQDPELKIDKENIKFWDYVKELQDKGYKIAMHGYNHLCDSEYEKNKYSEFVGYSYEEQLEKIKNGKRELEEHGINTDIFFAPRHSYDDYTLKALSKAGFKYISDGKSFKPIVRNGIICIPCRSYGCPKIRCSNYYTAVFHTHEWKREDKKVGYVQLSNLCKDYHNYIVDFDQYIDRKTGNYFFQNIDEKIYKIWERKIRPVLSKIKHKIFK